MASEMEGGWRDNVTLAGRLNFRVHRMDQGLKVAVAESIRLDLAWVIGMSRHMVRADRAGKLHVPQDAHDLEEVHLSLVGIHFREVVKAAADIAHVNLVYLSALAQVFDDREDFAGRTLYPFRNRAQAQLEPVIRTVDDRFVSLEAFEDRGRVPILGTLIAER